MSAPPRLPRFAAASDATLTASPRAGGVTVYAPSAGLISPPPVAAHQGFPYGEWSIHHLYLYLGTTPDKYRTTTVPHNPHRGIFADGTASIRFSSIERSDENVRDCPVYLPSSTDADFLQRVQIQDAEGHIHEGQVSWYERCPLVRKVVSPR